MWFACNMDSIKMTTTTTTATTLANNQQEQNKILQDKNERFKQRITMTLSKVYYHTFQVPRRYPK